MNVVWNMVVNLPDLWLPECFGLFCKKENQVSFFFKHRNELMAVLEEKPDPHVVHFFERNEKFPLPHTWAVVEEEKSRFLMFSEDVGFDLLINQYTCHVSDEIRKNYNQKIRPANYYVEAPHPLGEFTVMHKGNCGYICKKEEEVLWQFTGRAYLYTDMMRWRDRLFFGTGGNGGYFYILDIHSGVPLASIKTGGTRCVVQVDNLCYVLANEKNAQLLCVDLSDGRVVMRCDLPGIARLESRIALIEGCIHVITFDVSRSTVKGFIWTCLKI